MRRKLGLYLTPVLSVVGVLLVWEFMVRIFAIPAFILPGPTRIWASALKHGHLLGDHVVNTTIEAVVGLLVGALVGVILAALMVHVPFLERIIMPILVVDQSIPKLALAPLFIIWFGYGMTSKVFIAAVISFFPIIVNTAKGLSSVDKRLEALLHTLSASKWQFFYTIRAPNALPFLFSAIKVAVPLSVVGAVVGEFVQADKGLGYMILLSVTDVDTPRVFVCVVLLAIISLSLFALTLGLEYLTLRRRFTFMTPDESQH